jgi:small conductance mechanosensitive channel
MIDILLSNLDELLLAATNILPKIIAALIAFLIVILFGRTSSKVIKKLLSKSDISEIHSDLCLKISKIFFLFIAVILFLNIVGLKSIAAGLFAGGGVVAVVSGFALREIGENFFAGMLLSFNRPFKKGDLIKSGNYEGSVKSIDVRNTHIRSSDGQDIFIPSAQIYKNALINYTKDGLRRFSLKIGISYDNDIHLACKIINQEMLKVPGIIKTPKPNVSLNEMLPNYVNIEMFFWVNVFSSNNNVSKIRTDLGSRIKEELLNNDFTLSTDVSSNLNLKVSHNLPNPEEGMAH